MNRRSLMRMVFRIVNSLIIVPAFQMKLGWIVSNSLTGWIMVIGTTGRKSGLVRYTPVSFARIGSFIYCYQGKGTKGQWYLNILANPQVEVILPRGERFIGIAEDVRCPEEKAAAIRQVLMNSGANRGMYGFDPSTAAEAVLLDIAEEIPAIRIIPKV